jgi:hypothetical protein
MFCPICKAEYRFGFAKCSDCGVDLVEHLPDDAGVQIPNVDPDAMVILWAGMEAATRESIEHALEAANVKYDSDNVESQLMPAFRTTIHRIWVRGRDHASAANLIRGFGFEDPSKRSSPGYVQDKNSSFLNMLGINRNQTGAQSAEEAAAPVDAGSSSEPEVAEQFDVEDSSAADDFPAQDAVEDFYPEDATSEVWSGEDAQVAEFIKAALNANGIGCVILDASDKQRAMVLRADESRAKEIVREIVEDTPPK